MTRPNPISVDCPQCEAPIGTRCKNYKGGNCAPHADRNVRAAQAQAKADAAAQRDHARDKVPPAPPTPPAPAPAPRVADLPEHAYRHNGRCALARGPAAWERVYSQADAHIGCRAFGLHAPPRRCRHCRHLVHTPTCTWVAALKCRIEHNATRLKVTQTKEGKARARVEKAKNPDKAARHASTARRHAARAEQLEVQLLRQQRQLAQVRAAQQAASVPAAEASL